MTAPIAEALTPGGFRKGAVAMMDALGFRGIWKRVELLALLKNLEVLEKVLSVDVDELCRSIGFAKPVVEVRFLSDTVLFTVAHDLPFTSREGESPETETGPVVPIAPFSVEVAAAFAALLQARAASSSVPLAFRGAIGFGEYFVKDNYLIGPAIDEVALAHQVANGALVFLLPSASAALRLYPESLRDRGVLRTAMIPDYRVPLKRLRWLRRAVVNPLGFPSLRPDVSDRILATFGNPSPLSSIWWKRRATEHFLKAATLHLESLNVKK